MSGQTEMALADALEAYRSRYSNEWATSTPSLSWADLDIIVAALRRPAPTEPDIRAALETEIKATAAAIIDFTNSSHTPPRIAGYVTERIWHIANLAAISPAGDTGREAVPVAWQCRFKINNMWSDWILLKDYCISEFRQAHADGLESEKTEVRALYASPLPAARIGREEIARIIDPTFKQDFDEYCDMKGIEDEEKKERWTKWLDGTRWAEALAKADAILSLTASAPAGGCTDARANGKTGDARS